MRQLDVLKWVSKDSEHWYPEALGIYRVLSDQLLRIPGNIATFLAEHHTTWKNSVIDRRFG